MAIPLTLLMMLVPTAAADCLAEALPESRRRNVTIDGVNEAVRLYYPRADKMGMVWTETVKILVEEVLGYKVVFNTPSCSGCAINELVGCEAEDQDDSLPDCVDESKAKSTSHVAGGIWWTYGAPNYFNAHKNRNSQRVPVHLGNIGWSSYSAEYVKRTTFERALNEQGLVLDSFRSYDLTHHKPYLFFDDITHMDFSMFTPCDQIIDNNAADEYAKHETFLRHYGAMDPDGLETFTHADGTTKVRPRCWLGDDHNSHKGMFWLSPACRSNASTCVPWVTSQFGWSMDEMMHRAVAHNMAVALLFSEDWTTVARAHNVMFHWWQPDSEFADMDLVQVTFPEVNLDMNSAQNWAHTAPQTSIDKLVHFDLKRAAEPVYQLVDNMYPDMAVQPWLQAMKSSTHTKYDVACEWLRNNKNVWEQWVPDVTECSPGKGLYKSSGSAPGYVQTVAEAEHCRVCPVGTYSSPFIDPVASKYTRTCMRCPTGTLALREGTDGHCDPEPQSTESKKESDMALIVLILVVCGLVLFCTCTCIVCLIAKERSGKPLFAKLVDSEPNPPGKTIGISNFETI